MKNKILIGIGPKNHIRLALDEIEGLQEKGYQCKSIIYGRNADRIGLVNRLWGVTINALKIVFALYKFSPNVIYLNSRFEPVGPTRDFISILIFRSLYWKKTRIIIKSHGSDLSIFSKQSFFYRKIVLPFLIKQVSTWFFLSNDEKNAITYLCLDMAQKVEVTSNIIDPGRSCSSPTFRHRYSLDTGKFNILFVGRIVRVKGLFSIVNSISLLDFREKCSFIIVGNGSDLVELKALAERLNVSQYITFLGYIPDEECDHFYANTDVLIYPTFDTEGFPMALFKSVAAGLPIITTQIRAAKDHLKAPDNALWVDGESPESIAAAITTLYRDEALRATMSANNITLGKKFARGSICLEMSKSFSSH